MYSKFSFNYSVQDRIGLKPPDTTVPRATRNGYLYNLRGTLKQNMSAVCPTVLSDETWTKQNGCNLLHQMPYSHFQELRERENSIGRLKKNTQFQRLFEAFILTLRFEKNKNAKTHGYH